jgi:hypothetical protein
MDTWIKTSGRPPAGQQTADAMIRHGFSEKLSSAARSKQKRFPRENASQINSTWTRPFIRRWTQDIRGRLQDTSRTTWGTVEDVGRSIATAQDNNRADAAAAVLRLLSTFIDSTVKSSLLFTPCRSVSDSYCIKL